MRFTGPAAAAQVLARAWLLAAAASLLVPPETRLGWWLPLHLALAGAAGTAVSGALPLFATTLAGARQLPQRWDPVVLITVGAASIAAGRPLGIRWLVALGGTAYGVGALRLTWLVLRGWLVGTNRRHAMTLLAYGAASLALTVGVTLGALLGTGAVGGTAFLGVRDAHITLNTEGFLALTVAGSLLILIPVVLRVRAPDVSGRPAILGLTVGVFLQAAGHAAMSSAMVVVGAAIAVLAAVELVRVSALTVARRPRMMEPAAAWHLLGVPLWLAGVTTAVLVHAVRGDPVWPLPLTAALTLGVFVQALVGAWSYLLPVSDPGGSASRRARLERTRPWARTRSAVFNAGAATAILAASGALPGTAGSIGLGAAIASALTGVAMAARPAKRIDAERPAS